MAEQSKGSQPKTLEMRVAELEDKLSKVHITEEEMKAYQKVSSLMGSQQMQAAIPAACVYNCLRCISTACISVGCIQPACIRQICINECTCGPCACIQQTSSGGGFGNLGS